VQVDRDRLIGLILVPKRNALPGTKTARLTRGAYVGVVGPGLGTASRRRNGTRATPTYVVVVGRGGPSGQKHPRHAVYFCRETVTASD